jgi:uncharacterized LabA/DUF88 family protein
MFYRDERWRCSLTAPIFMRLRRRWVSTSTTSCCGRNSCAGASCCAPSTIPRFWKDEDYSPIRPLVDWLHYNGFSMVTKPAKEYTDSQGRRKVKGNMDIELTVDAMELAPRVDHIVLFSGDGDFKPLVEACSARACASRSSRPSARQPPMIADELRRQADNFIELDDLREVIGRPPREPRPDREETAAPAAQG